MMHRKANRSVRKAKKKRRTIIGNAVCLLIASVVFTACSNSEYDDKHSKLYNAVYEVPLMQFLMKHELLLHNPLM